MQWMLNSEANLVCENTFMVQCTMKLFPHWWIQTVHGLYIDKCYETHVIKWNGTLNISICYTSTQPVHRAWGVEKRSESHSWLWELWEPNWVSWCSYRENLETRLTTLDPEGDLPLFPCLSLQAAQLVTYEYLRRFYGLWQKGEWTFLLRIIIKITEVARSI